MSHNKKSKEGTAPYIKLVREKKKFDEVKFQEAINRVPWHACKKFDEVNNNMWIMEEMYKKVLREIYQKSIG